MVKYKANGKFSIVDEKEQPVCRFGGTTYTDAKYTELRDEFLRKVNEYDELLGLYNELHCKMLLSDEGVSDRFSM